MSGRARLNTTATVMVRRLSAIERKAAFTGEPTARPSMALVGAWADIITPQATMIRAGMTNGGMGVLSATTPFFVAGPGRR